MLERVEPLLIIISDFFIIRRHLILLDLQEVG